MADYTYHDRKMMKWMPFNALLEQGDYLSDLLRGKERIEMPVLSPDQEAELNYKLESAYLFRNQIIVTYYESHKYKTVEGIIERTDLLNKLIFIGETSISALQIIDIEVI